MSELLGAKEPLDSELSGAAYLLNCKPRPNFELRRSSLKQSDTLPSRNSSIQKLTLTNTTDRVVERRSGPLNVCCL